MMLKTLIIAALAVVAFAEDFQVPEDKRQELRNILTDFCKKNGAEDKVNDVENAGKTFFQCIKELVDFPTIQREIEEAKPNGALDEVFKKYCAKTPQLKGCIHTFLDGTSACLDTVARDHVATVKNATNELIDFICFKDGDRIALFIAEGGPQCFQSKVNDIKTCVDNIKKSFSSLEDAKNLTMKQRCDKVEELSRCVVSKLEQCDTPTPSNMFESLIKFIMRNTPCRREE